jgi:hypothetical protein
VMQQVIFISALCASELAKIGKTRAMAKKLLCPTPYWFLTKLSG